MGQRDGMEDTAVSVGCVTTDFSMQNVLLQMGLRVVSVDGMLVRRVKTFAFKCGSCHRITHETERQFCRGCGQPNLFKITVKTNEKGHIKYNMPRVKKNTTRGSVYSLPTMKMGRCDNIVLTEDAKELRRSRPKEKGVLDVFSDEYVSGDSPFKGTDHNVAAKKGIGMRTQTGVTIGMGRRNPNSSRRKTGNKKKK
jgi:RNA-binding protein NOB1